MFTGSAARSPLFSALLLEEGGCIASPSLQRDEKSLFSPFSPSDATSQDHIKASSSFFMSQNPNFFSFLKGVDCECGRLALASLQVSSLRHRVTSPRGAPHVYVPFVTV